MRLSAIKYTILTWASILSLLIIVITPFQGFLPVFGAHLLGHYTALRLWDEVFLCAVALGALYLIINDNKIRFNTLYRRLVWLIFGYLVLNIVLGVVAYVNHNVTTKALEYGLIVNLRFLIFFLVTWMLALRMDKLRNSWQRIIIWPAVGVVVFGLLQIFVLPHDFLRHFGYGANTIPVMETINHNSHYIRIASTLRGANPLGAYLILPITLIVLLISKSKKFNWKLVIFLLASLVVLFYSFSRSAWIGALLSVIFIILMTAHISHKHLKLLTGLAGLVILIGLILGFSLRNNQTFQNYVLHTQTHSSVKVSSDDQHSSALSSGIKEAIHEPLGRGPGTAGPASYYNHNERNPEDYYIQIAEEDGWLGIAMFVLILLGVGYILWLKRDDPLSIFLLASLIGITFANFLMYAWGDDTLAYIWWGLAGVAMARPIASVKAQVLPVKTKLSKTKKAA